MRISDQVGFKSRAIRSGLQMQSLPLELWQRSFAAFSQTPCLTEAVSIWHLPAKRAERLLHHPDRKAARKQQSKDFSGGQHSAVIIGPTESEPLESESLSLHRAARPRGYFSGLKLASSQYRSFGKLRMLPSL